MKKRKFCTRAAILALSAFFIFIMGCNKDNDNNKVSPQPKDSCQVILFDGDQFEDDTISLEGSGSYPDLSNLPHANKDWDDEADSFKAGKNAIVKIFTKPNFQGDSTVYGPGAQEPSVDSVRSIKITCIHKMEPYQD